jgi:DNA-binding transcriptional ArsR family regulator
MKESEEGAMPMEPEALAEADVCFTRCIHRDAVQAARQEMADPVAIAQLADFYKLFGDSTRIGILAALSTGELCVCDLCFLLNMKQPAVSHQLRILKQARVVQTRRDGKVIYYSLSDDHIRKVLSVGLEHLQE